MSGPAPSGAAGRLLRGPVPGLASSPLGDLASGFFQVAYVTPDLDRVTAMLSQQAGVGEFFVIRDAPVEDQTLRGVACECHQDLAFGFAGNLQFEVIQPLSGSSTYSEFLHERPGGGVHHTGVLVEDYDAAVAEHSKRLTVVQTGRAGTTRFAYLDTFASLGAYLELVYLGPEFLELFERLQAREL